MNTAACIITFYLLMKFKIYLPLYASVLTVINGRPASQVLNTNPNTNNSAPIVGFTKSGSYGILSDIDYPYSTLQTLKADDEIDCVLKCHAGCDFVTYQRKTKDCSLKYTDKSANLYTYFKQQDSGFVLGQLRCNPKTNDQMSCLLSSGITWGIGSCKRACVDDPQCHYIVFKRLAQYKYDCRRYSMSKKTGMSLVFRLNHLPLNANPERKGRFEVIGSSGVVAIHSNLLPDGKVLFTARPESLRGGPNTEMVARSKVPYGEIASVFDPLSGKVIPSFVDDNVFCHGALLNEEGQIFMTGGDVGNEDGGNPSAQGLAYGLNKQRYFHYQTNTWEYANDMLRPRWYPSPVRTVDGSMFIIGGATNGSSGIPERTIEIYRRGQQQNQLVKSPFLERTGAGWYPTVGLIPKSGNIFIFGNSNWAIVDSKSGKEIEQEKEKVTGIRQGNYPSGAVFLALRPEKNYKGEFAIFGGINNEKEEIALDTVARIVLTDDGQKTWSYDQGRMPYGRVNSNAILQPNGKVLILNGAQLGKTGGSIGFPFMNASALHCFAYDPEKADGQRFSLLNASPIQRLYHSSALVLPDGRTLIAGTDQATFSPKEAYEHRVEAFTPPWLVGTSRPVIVSAPEDKIKYDTVFEVQYTGRVDAVSLMAPGSSTHGVDFSQRLVFLKIENNDGKTLRLRSPPDATIALQGYQMLFILDGEVPSVAKFIRLG